jgi:hypothetical protein
MAGSVVVVHPPVVDDDVVASSEEVRGEGGGIANAGVRRSHRWGTGEGGGDTVGIPFSLPRHCRQRDAVADDSRVRSRIAIIPSLLLAITTTSTAVGGGLGRGGMSSSSPPQSCVSDNVGERGRPEDEDNNDGERGRGYRAIVAVVTFRSVVAVCHHNDIDSSWRGAGKWGGTSLLSTPQSCKSDNV